MADGILPIFPLPNVVLFPGLRLPLHIFEPRYRRMLEDALAAGSRIGMVLLREGGEKDTEGAPETYRVGSHGRVSEVRRLPDGRYDLVLEDATRYEIAEYLQQTPYRLARVRPLPEEPPPEPEEARRLLHDLVRLYAALARLVGEDPAPQFFPDHPQEFEQHVNTMAMSLRVHPSLRQDLLEVPGPAERARRLEALLARLVERLGARKRFERLKPGPHSFN